ncbi:hypothetical protein EYF80_067958 [Liparis tanakae]|uniref:Uncharacterized protein n=1 Tax=Liparis tanakae TaxID=230148 RepID=A0A4Z2E0A3_9TELE|nr:hypothetical protein EYF80_067958 [Liparis tanakae]
MKKMMMKMMKMKERKMGRALVALRVRKYAKRAHVGGLDLGPCEPRVESPNLPGNSNQKESRREPISGRESNFTRSNYSNYKMAAAEDGGFDGQVSAPPTAPGGAFRARRKKHNS